MGKFDIKEKSLWVDYDPKNRFYTSKWNLREEVKAELNLPKNVTILDTTLREGEDTPGVVYALEQKVKIAKALEEIGVPEIDCGFVSLSRDHYDAAKAIKEEGLHIKTMAMTRVDVDNPEAAIDRVIDAGVDVISVIIYGIPLPGFTTAEDYINLIKRSVKYVKKRGAFCSFELPATRWEQNIAGKLYEAAIQGGTDRLGIGGSGCLGPNAYKLMVKWLKKIAGDKQVSVHCHDTLGLATACALCGVEAGAEVVHTTINGMSDGGGLAAFEEIVVALTSIYGFDLKIKLENIQNISEMIQEITKIPVHSYKSLVGKSVFVEGPDSHLDRIFRGDFKWSDSFLIKPEVIGQKLSIFIGPPALAGKAIRSKARQMGLDLNDDELESVRENMRKSFKTKDGLTERELEIIINRIKSL